MATSNDDPTRIDQVFADPRWVGEALTAAAADARERHRRAGVPMVVVRDGQIDHVPAERLVADFAALLRDIDFDAERPARELIAWFEERRSAISSCRLAKEPALLHQGRFKKFYEELYPFALWVGHRYAGRGDVMCSVNSTVSADHDYDATVTDRSTHPPTTTYVQLTTTTFDRDESLRMKRFLTGEVVSAYGPPDELGWLAKEETLKAAFGGIARAVERKALFPFGPNHVLVVCFDDFMWFGTEDDRAALASFVTTRLPSWNLNVATLYIVGISGRTFLSFPTSGR